VTKKPCGMHYSWPSHGTVKAGTIGPCVLDVADHHERHRDEHGNEWLNVQWALARLDAAPADRPVPVSPPVDALEEILNLVEEVALARVKAHAAANRDDGPRAAQHGDRAKALRLAIAVAVEGVRAAGVEEGRRQATAEAAQVSAYLDTPDGRRRLRELLRTGEIVLRGGDGRG